MKITVEVTKKHFDAAYAAGRKGKLITSTCLLAQAVKSVFPRKQVYVYNHTVDVGKTVYTLPVTATRLIERFDNLNLHEVTPGFKKLRDALPISFKMSDEVQA